MEWAGAGVEQSIHRPGLNGLRLAVDLHLQQPMRGFNE
jgi:hypothetical protein